MLLSLYVTAPSVFHLLGLVCLYLVHVLCLFLGFLLTDLLIYRWNVCSASVEIVDCIRDCRVLLEIYRLMEVSISVATFYL